VIDGHLVIPKSGSGGGVLILHSWWGLNSFFKNLCQRFADEGFVALAADLYSGRVATTVSEARRLRAAVTASRKEPAYKYLTRLIRLLCAHESVSTPKIAVVGFSMGGHWAFWMGQRPELPIAATTTFYAARNGDYSENASSFLCHFAERDEWVSTEAIRKLGRGFEKAGCEFTFHTYPGTSHWFFEEDRTDVFHPKASELAWERTVDFTRKILKPKRIQPPRDSDANRGGGPRR
jgi:carboxymethylenebutenolidase